jgi:heterodisulfide reductase subunit B
MTAYSYFPGCSLTSTAIEYDTSFRLVSKTFDLELQVLEDWNCCGASPAPHHWGGDLGVFLPARNLHIAGKTHASMVAPCAGCYTRHKYAQHELSQNERLRQTVEKALDEPVNYTTRVLNVIEFFNETISAEAMSDSAGGRLSGVNLATYYGCVLTRPAKILEFDDPKNPVSMEKLLLAGGASIPPFAFKTDCCGAYMSLVDKSVLMKASRRIIENAIECGADAIVTACPLCHQNLDLRQRQINDLFGTSFEIPVLYFSQALGLGLGMTPEELGIDAHAVPVKSLMQKIQAQQEDEDALVSKVAGEKKSQ